MVNRWTRGLALVLGCQALACSGKDDATTGDRLPLEPMPVERMPVEAMPVEATPVEATPVESMPVGPMLVESMPVEPMPVAPMPVAPSRPPAPTAGSPCALAPDGVATIERPMFPDRESSPTFGYSYKIHPGTDPSAATVIYLPGGPGEAGIAEVRDEDYAPLSFPLLQTDLRGTGCNAPETVDHYPDEFYRSIYFADDVIAIIEQLKLDNYVLYGISYGTQLATLVASRIEARGLPPPRAVVLEGVLGTAFTRDQPGDEVAFQELWRSQLGMQDPEVQAQFSADPLPLGLSAEEWGAGIAGASLYGASPDTNGLNLLSEVLQAVSPSATDELRTAVTDLLRGFAAPPVDALGKRLHDLVACREIAEEDFDSMKLDHAELVPLRSYCGGVELSEPYFASDWPVHAPIYYFSGTADPATPPWQALAHFDAELTAPRQLVHVIGGGHNPRVVDLPDCAEPLWQAMATGNGFDAALATCSWPTELESAAAEP